MNIPSVITDPMIVLFTRIIFQNELGSNHALIYKFSDPDGVRTGRSGWSFGICQFDITHNPNAIHALREMDFTTDEIEALRTQSGNFAMQYMNTKLQAHKEIVDKWDRRQVLECLLHPMKLCGELSVNFFSIESFYHIADYHNQFYMSRGGKLYQWLKRQTLPVRPEDIREYKMSLPWGKKRPDDIDRRYNAIRRICDEK